MGPMFIGTEKKLLSLQFLTEFQSSQSSHFESIGGGKSLRCAFLGKPDNVAKGEGRMWDICPTRQNLRLRGRAKSLAH